MDPLELLQKRVERIFGGIQDRLIDGSVSVQDHVLEDVVKDFFDGSPVLIEVAGYAGNDAIVEHEDSFVDDLKEIGKIIKAKYDNVLANYTI